MKPQDLREMIGRMTAGEWHTQPCAHGGLILLRGPGEDAPRKDRHPQSHLQIVPEADATGIATLRNLAPALVELWEAVEAYRVAYAAMLAPITSTSEDDWEAQWSAKYDAEKDAHDAMLAAAKRVGA